MLMQRRSQNCYCNTEHSHCQHHIQALSECYTRQCKQQVGDVLRGRLPQYLDWLASVWCSPSDVLIDHKLLVPAAGHAEPGVPQCAQEQSSSSECNHAAADQCRGTRRSCCPEQSHVANGQSAPTFVSACQEG